MEMLILQQSQQMSRLTSFLLPQHISSQFFLCLLLPERLQKYCWSIILWCTIQLIRFEAIVQHYRSIARMDLEWLLPEQIEQILKLCDLSSIQDPTFAANILEQHHWNLEFALHDLVQQNDEIQHRDQLKHAPPAPKKESAWNPKKEEFGFQHEESEFEVEEELYHQLDQPETQPQQHQHRNILAQQNKEYEAMEKSYIAKLAEDEQLSQYQQLKDREFSEHKEEFAAHTAERPIQIKFRLASRVQLFAFDLTDKVQKVFKYVSGHFREDFDNKYAEFDLTQAFPAITLKDKQEQTLEQVFGESSGEVLIVREL